MIRIWGEEWDVQRTFIVLRNGSPVGHVADVEAGSDGVGRHLILCAQKHYLPLLSLHWAGFIVLFARSQYE